VSFGGSLASLRSKWGISQAELAGRAGVAQSTVSDIESGRIDPKISTALKLLYALGVNLVRISYEDGKVAVRPYTGTGYAPEPELLAAVADSLALLRGRAQLAEDRLRKQVLASLGEITRELSLIQAEVDKLSRMVGLLRSQKP